ncbi:MAG: alanine--glyoxylate aminotransferase family protein [Gemmatimonadaceae bacterium]
MSAPIAFLPNLAQVRQRTLDVMARQSISHRSPEFHELFARVQDGLRTVFRTERPIYVATASGTGMMEAAIRCAPRGRILCLVNGVFGERFVRIARSCGRNVEQYNVAAGDVPSADAVGRLLEHAEYSALTMIHNETSTGALADVAAIAQKARDAGVATIVDSVSGIGGARLESEAWQLDCVVSASQKALGLPPGLSFATASEQYLRTATEVDGRGLYLDLVDFDAHARNSETPTTPNVPLIYALDTQLASIVAEGMDARWRRHSAMRALTEQWVESLRDEIGPEFGILALPGVRSPTVTVLTLPAEIRPERVIAGAARYGYQIGAGQGAFKTNTVRIGHMGDHSVEELDGCLAAVSSALREVRD